MRGKLRKELLLFEGRHSHITQIGRLFWPLYFLTRVGKNSVAIVLFFPSTVGEKSRKELLFGGGILTLPKLGDSLDTRSEKKKKTGGRKRGDHWLSTSFSTHFLPIPLSHLISELENFLADALSHQSWKNICCNCAVSSMYCLPKSFNIFVFHTSMYFAIATLKRSVFELLKKVMPMM